MAHMPDGSRGCNWSDANAPLSDAAVWRCYGKMTDLIFVDFRSLAKRRQVNVPQLLFPSARYVSLSGHMTYALAYSLLYVAKP